MPHVRARARVPADRAHGRPRSHRRHPRLPARLLSDPRRRRRRRLGATGGHRPRMTLTKGGDPSMTLSTETKATAFGDYVEVADGVHLFCRHAGVDNGGPPVLLLHGNRDNHSHWAEVEQLLARSHHTVAIDFRGHGLSSKVDCPLSPELLGDDIRALCDHYGFGRVVLAGHSLGSVVSMTFTHRWPDRVERLVLLGSAASFTLKFKRPPLPRDEAEFARLIRDANRR